MGKSTRKLAVTTGAISAVIAGVLGADESRRRFASNFGLARSRADAVRRAILQECLPQDPACSLPANQKIVLA